MGNARTNSLHEKLTPEKRREVERDLIEQPPGRETYAKVFEYHGLADHGVGLKALERYGGYLRTLARNQWIAEVADSVVGQDVGGELAGLIRARLFSALVTGETKMGDLLKAAIAQKTLTDSEVRLAELEQKRRQVEAAVKRAERDGGEDPQRAMHDMVEDIKSIYGLNT